MKPTVELIIRVSRYDTIDNINFTLQSAKNIDCVSFCFSSNYSAETKAELNKNILELPNERSWKIHFPTEDISTTECINLAAEKSTCDYYVFVNAGHKLPDDFNIPEDSAIFMIEPVDDQWNEFICRTKIHKRLCGFGKEISLIQKWDALLEQLKAFKERESE